MSLAWMSRHPTAILTSLGALSAVVNFRMLGGRFTAVCPSHLLFTGAHAVESIPARRHIHATPAEKRVVNAFGSRYGCHTCGTRSPTSFIADHQPPSKFAADAPKERVKFLPHCGKCSSKQGGMARSAARLQWSGGGRAFLRTHGTALRAYHLWVPLAPAMALAVGLEQNPFVFAGGAGAGAGVQG